MLLLDSAARGKRQHLPGRSQFPERRLRRLSRSRAAARPQGNRAAAGAARPPAPGDHAVAAPFGPVADRRAEPAGRDAHLRSGHGDAAARSGVVAFRLCRDRHAAHLVLLDRQRAARLEPALHRQRDDGAEPAPRQGPGGRDPRAARRGPASAGHRQPLRAEDVRARPEEGRHRAGAGRSTSPAPFRTPISWCARRSTAACRSTRSSRATRSPRSFASWCCRRAPPRPMRRGAPSLLQKLSPSWAK